MSTEEKEGEAAWKAPPPGPGMAPGAAAGKAPTPWVGKAPDAAVGKAPPPELGAALGATTGRALPPEMAMTQAAARLTAYSGDSSVELASSNTWVASFRAKMQRWSGQYQDDFFQAVLLKQVKGQALELLQAKDADTVEDLLQALVDGFPRDNFHLRLLDRVRDGSAFRGATHDNIIARLTGLAHEFGENAVCRQALGVATRDLLPRQWETLRLNPDKVTLDKYLGALRELDEYLGADPRIRPTLFGKAAAQAPAHRPSEAAKAPAKASAKPTPSAPDKSGDDPKRQSRKDRRKRKVAREKEEIERLRAENEELKIQSSRGN
ncbi:hypothetical protein IWQ57_001529 [Coemansia nantahalensis]|uniref:Uncharacterized protein n=1 Tax=Coemansia nantahalensis TaxID=2789366 RepID=A0ACC1K463_9FUNG|nr:hypothetical protein IWQ57_001529 [Coemansia nantahalensis]